MGLTIVRLHEKDEEAKKMFTCTERLCLNQDRTRLVQETDTDAYWLYCVPGGEIPLEDAIRYGLAEPEPEPEPEPVEEVEAEVETVEAEGEAQAEPEAEDKAISEAPATKVVKKARGK